MKIYNETNVYDAALSRIRFLFDEFPTVIVGFSGGKDSTVCLNLALKVAEEKNRLPLKVMFIDQEAEWNHVIEYIRGVMNNPKIDPIWLQVPIKLFNSTSSETPWLQCWEPGRKWMREKEPNSIHENRFGTDRFAKMFEQYVKTEFPGEKVCYVSGVRAEESPARYTTLTYTAKYKHITWAKRLSKTHEHFTFYPLYDWWYSDIWKAIHDNHWPYCPIYDFMFQRGVKIQEMRVSNVHHETATKSLYILQEIEPDTWQRLTSRLHGINTAGQLKHDAFHVKEIPFMFKSWPEYRDYLLEHLITDPDIKQKFELKFFRMAIKYRGMKCKEEMFKEQVNTILSNDFYFTKLSNWEMRPMVNDWRKYKKGIDHPNHSKNKYITGKK